MKYDSAKDTREHIGKVASGLLECAQVLYSRAENHDQSKLHDPEKGAFDRLTPKLKGSTYGSDEYKELLGELGTALRHHYTHNSHHPEHYENGVLGMSLFDLIEMLADWRAAAERHANGDFAESMRINRKRFNIPDAIYALLRNTVVELGWRRPEELEP